MLRSSSLSPLILASAQGGKDETMIVSWDFRILYMSNSAGEGVVGVPDMAAVCPVEARALLELDRFLTR